MNAKLTEIKAPYTEEQFNKMLKQRNLTLDDFKRDIRRGLTETKLMNKEIESKINITDAQIAAFYAAHKSDFNSIEPQYHLAQIVVTTAPAQQSAQSAGQQGHRARPTPRGKSRLRYSQLESGEDFATVAMNFSEDPNTASNGGDMGFVPSRNSRPILWSMTQSANSSPISSPMCFPSTNRAPEAKIAGYAIYKLISREPAGQRELNDPKCSRPSTSRCTTARSNCCRPRTSRC